MLRLLISFAVGCGVVLAMLLAGLWAGGAFRQPAPPGLEAHNVDLLTAEEKRELRPIFGDNLTDVNRPLAAPPVPRQGVGFVELEVDIAPDGSVASARVISSTHPGVYEDKALQQILQRQFEPLPGVADPDQALRTRQETVRYSLDDEDY